MTSTTIILVGFMGAGKTTVGQMLARRLGWEFVDLDDCIREREKRSIPEIFEKSGEEHFRRVENECLREVLEQSSVVGHQSSEEETRGPSTTSGKSGPPPLGMTKRGGLVLALGGGAFVQPENEEIIRQAKFPIVFLDGEPDTLFRRCAPHAGERPLLADQNQFRQLYESRREGYMRAGVRVDTTALTPGQVADEIAVRLDLPDYS